MKTTFLSRFSIITLLVIFAVAAFPSLSSASHSWGNYHWARTSNPFTLKLGDNVSSTWDSYLSTTSTDWSKSTVLNTTIVAGGTRPKNCRPTSGRAEVCSERYGNTGWLGVAQIWVSGSHIKQGTVKVNDTYFNTSTYNTTAWRNLVMCQEVGHIFGLDHQDENFNNPPLGTCMDYSNDPVPNQHPNAHDYEQLEAIYAHLDSTTTVGAMPAAMANGEFSTPAEWGELVKSSADGRVATYARDFGRGHKIFTFVFWVEETGQ
jgi:hypothetical protein